MTWVDIVKSEQLHFPGILAGAIIVLLVLRLISILDALDNRELRTGI